MRDIFTRARSCSPSILFIDEIDVIVGKRELGEGNGNSVNERILSALLNEIDGISNSSGVMLIVPIFILFARLTERVQPIDPT